MVDIVRMTDTAGNAVEVVDGSEDIVKRDVLRDKLISLFGDVRKRLGVLHAVNGVEHFEHNLVADVFVDTDFVKLFFCEVGKIGLDVNHVVRDDLDGVFSALDADVSDFRTGLLDFVGSFLGNQLALFGDDFAGSFVNYGSGETEASDSVGKGKLFIVFIASDS